MKKKQILSLALASLATVSTGLVAGSAFADKADMEKCYGVVKTGKNDCGTKQHPCAGQAAKDSHPEEWIYLPTGTCEKLTGGRLSAEDGAMDMVEPMEMEASSAE